MNPRTRLLKKFKEIEKKGEHFLGLRADEVALLERDFEEYERLLKKRKASYLARKPTKVQVKVHEQNAASYQKNKEKIKKKYEDAWQENYVKELNKQHKLGYNKHETRKHT